MPGCWPCLVLRRDKLSVLRLLGDLIVSVDGTAVRQVEDLLSAVEERQAGEAVTLRVLRGCDPQREETLKVRLGSAR